MINDARTLSNPEVSKLATRLVERIELELRGMMLSETDAAFVLLAAAHGRSRAAGWTREELVMRAAGIWEHCDQGREPVKKPVDFDVRPLPPRLFQDANRVAKPTLKGTDTR